MSRKFNNKKFIKDVLNDRYALVIGNENILDTRIEPTGDVHQYILRKVNEDSNVQYESYHEIALDKNERINPVRQLVENGEIKFSADDVSKELRALLETRLFTTVLTTTTDGYLEAAMRKVWGSELRVVNIYEKETVDELQKALKACRRGKKYNQPTLIYVFGKLDVDDLSKKYIKTDADAIKRSKILLFMSSEYSNKSRNVVSEVSIVVEYGKKIIPVRLDLSPYSESIEYDIINHDYVVYDKSRIEVSNREMLKKIVSTMEMI